MTVAELIAWLQTQPQGEQVVIHDADTEWFLPLRTGMGQAGWNISDQPPNSVIVHGTYDDAIMKDPT